MRTHVRFWFVLLSSRLNELLSVRVHMQKVLMSCRVFYTRILTRLGTGILVWLLERMLR